VTENGTSEDEPDLASALRDEGRRQYMEQYLRACAEAIELGVPLKGYFAWSLMDNFEWEYGYTKRFGMCFVDFETLERTPKSSAIWYGRTIQAGGSNIRRTITEN
jgi:beta-glucosidase/6-phospho-beta-glucosidase/beta-galactosidase